MRQIPPGHPPIGRTVGYSATLESMSPGHHPISYADLAIDRFQNWPLTECRADHAPGRAMALHGLQLVHLHRADLAEAFLTQKIACRLGTALTASGRVDIPADTGWVQVHLDTDSDLSLLESLVSLAIQANDPTSHPLHRTMTPCPAYAPRLASRSSWRRYRAGGRRGRVNMPAWQAPTWADSGGDVHASRAG
jgi:hypothetical protein